MDVECVVTLYRKTFDKMIELKKTVLSETTIITLEYKKIFEDTAWLKKKKTTSQPFLLLENHASLVSGSSNEKHVRLAQFSLKDRRFLLEDGTGRGRINDGDNHKASWRSI